MKIHIYHSTPNKEEKMVFFSIREDDKKSKYQIIAPIDLEGDDLISYIRQNFDQAVPIVTPPVWLLDIIEIDDLETPQRGLKNFLRRLVLQIRDKEIRK